MATIFPYGMGMRSTASFDTPHIRPKNYRDTILRLWPNGSAPLTAIMSAAKSRQVDDPHYFWFEKEMPLQAGPVTAISAYNQPKGTTITLTVAADTAKEFRAGHIVRILKSGEYATAFVARVISVVINGAASTLTVTQMEASPNEAGLNYVAVIGNSNAEGALIPDSISYDPARREGLTQIFRTPLDITRTARKTRYRTGDAYAELVRDSLEIHSIEMEKAFLYGVMDEWIGTNNQPQRTTEGLITTIKNYSGDNGTSVNNQVWDYTLESDTFFNNKSWLDAGKFWIDLQLEKLFRYGRTTKMGLATNDAILGLNQLAEVYGMYNLEVGMTKFGMSITRWVTPFGEIYLKSHPLLNHSQIENNMIVLFEPENLVESYIDQTHKKKDDGEKKGGSISMDGIKEEFLTETGFEYHQARTGAILYGVGKDHPGV